jgi:hypothetical protein
MELITLIIDELHVADKFLLAQTCQPMRNRLAEHGHTAITELRNSQNYNRGKFSAELAFAQPNQHLSGLSGNAPNQPQRCAQHGT